MIVYKIDQRDVVSLRGLEWGKWFRSARNINLLPPNFVTSDLEHL